MTVISGPGAQPPIDKVYIIGPIRRTKASFAITCHDILIIDRETAYYMFTPKQYLDVSYIFRKTPITILKVTRDAIITPSGEVKFDAPITGPLSFFNIGAYKQKFHRFLLDLYVNELVDYRAS